MRAIRGKNTRPELAIRRALHSAGFRFRLHSHQLPGKPDLVLSRYKAVVFVNGCFWHRHDCALFKLPVERRAFWQNKLAANVDRDTRAISDLTDLGWRVATVWECALKGRAKLAQEAVVSALSDWLRSNDQHLDIRGK